MDKQQLTAMINHTILAADTDTEQIRSKCQEAVEHKFAAVCVNPSFISLAREELAASEVKVCTVVGFPLGESSSETKAFETRNAIKYGAQEIEMVVSLGALKSGAWDLVVEDIEAVFREAKEKAVVKVIVESCYLTEEELQRIAGIIKDLGVDVIKTSTGFGRSGAEIEDIKLIKQVVGEQVEIEAAGGIRTAADAWALVEAGATRIGTSLGIELLDN